ncbi:hypothetical protein ENBRE01_1424 [Enteropsectra breve]|nr:hypothetical protein ENBRE01_1424 [Enteropsectra breve]
MEKAYVFRESPYEPSPVSALCSNNTVIVAFRKNRAVNLIDSKTKRCFLTHQLPKIVVSAKFIDLNTVLCLTACKHILLFNTETMGHEALGVTAVCFDCTFVSASFTSRNFICANEKNEIMDIKNGKASVLFREKSRITSILLSGQHIIYGTENGFIKTLKSGSIVSEIEASGAITRLIEAFENDMKRWVATSSDGNAFYIDAENSMVLDKIKIRNHPLTTAVFLNGMVHISGVDSRLAGFSFLNDKFVKFAQADYHCAEVLCSAVDNDEILTAGEDTCIAAHSMTDTRYFARIIYDACFKYGQTLNYIYRYSNNTLDLYNEIDSSNTQSEECQADEKGKALDASSSAAGINTTANGASDKILFKISEDVLVGLNQNQAKFNYFLSVKRKEMICSAAISFDEKYYAVSTAAETVFFSLFRGSKLVIEQIRKFEPAKQIIFTDKYLILVCLSKNILFFDLETFKIAHKRQISDLRENIYLYQNNIILSHSKVMVDLSDLNNEQKINIEGEVVDVGSAHLLVQQEKELYATDLSGSYKRDLSKYGNPFCFVNDNFMCDEKYLFKLESKFMRKYEIGSLIHGMVAKNDVLIVFQHNWGSVKSQFKKSVFKEKYSNK